MNLNLVNINSFDFKELLGFGAFGKVWKVIHKPDGKLYAVKVMSKNKILAKKSVKSVLL
jgi:serine/threonine protein kinase